MSVPVLVRIVDPAVDGPDVKRFVQDVQHTEGVEPWLVLVGPAADQPARESWATRCGLEKGRVILAGAQATVNPEVDPGPLATYLLYRFANMVGGRTVQLFVDPARPRTFATLAEVAAVVNAFVLRLPGIGVVPKQIPLTRRLAEALPTPGRAPELRGECEAMRRVQAQVKQYAVLPWPVLVLGETGTGKELVAQALHDHSERKGRFLPVNAALLADDRSAESDLFGHVKGAYTGATGDKDGRIEEAKNGTFFLDELPNLSPSLQGRLLRALNNAHEERIAVCRMGDDAKQEKDITVRFVGAAQYDPRKSSRIGGTMPLRDDLYWRIATLVIQLPPLKDRGEDVVVEATRTLEELRKLRHRELRFDDSALLFLRSYDWPGNFRELHTVIRRAWTLLDEGEEVVSAVHLTDTVEEGTAPRLVPLPCDLDRELARIGYHTARRALELEGGKPGAAGRLLGYEGDLNRKIGQFRKNGGIDDQQ